MATNLRKARGTKNSRNPKLKCLPFFYRYTRLPDNSAQRAHRYIASFVYGNRYFDPCLRVTHENVLAPTERSFKS